MRTNFGIAVIVLAAATQAFAQTPAPVEPGGPAQYPGNIVMGPGGYWEAGPALAGRGGRGAGRGGRGAVENHSVRPPDYKRTRTAVTGLMGWKVGVRTDAFRQLTFSEAAANVDALGLGFLEAGSEQDVSPELRKKLDPNLSPEDFAKVKSRLSDLRLQMVAYHVASLPADEPSLRKLFQFSRDLGAEMVIAHSAHAPLPELDRLATEFAVNIAFDDLSPKDVEKTLAGRSHRVGVVADLGKWAEEGIKPVDAVPLVKDRLMMLSILDRSAMGSRAKNVTPGSGVENIGGLLVALSKLDPPAAPAWPPKCANCTAFHVPPTRPLYISLEPMGDADVVADLTHSAAAFDMVVRPAMGWRVDELSRQTPTTPGSFVHPEDRKKIEAALPRQAIAKPAKPRKLLVVDLTPEAFYHASVSNGSLAIELMAKSTGAYEPTFSNDLSNLKYPAIKKFDAVFLNGIGGGEVFEYPDVLNGLLRFVREGGGVAGLHGSTFASLDVPEYGELFAAGAGNHRCCETSTVRIDDPNSPLTRAFNGKSFTWVDEFYHFPDDGPFSPEKVHILLSVDPEKSDMTPYAGLRKDNYFGLSWVRSYGKGRVFNCALGHTPALFQNPALAEHILAGLQFVLGDLKADTTPTRAPTKK